MPLPIPIIVALIAGAATIGVSAVSSLIGIIPDLQQKDAIKEANKLQKGMGDYAWKLHQKNVLDEEFKSGKRPRDKANIKAYNSLSKDIAKGEKKYPGVTAQNAINPQMGQPNVQGQQQPNQQGGQSVGDSQGGLWNGYRPYVDQLPLLNPQQTASQNSLLPGVTNRLMNENQSFDPIEASARNNFNRFGQGFLSNRLSSAGIRGPQYAASLALGGEQLESDLGAQRANWNVARRDQDQNLYSTLMNRNYENLYSPGSSGIKSKISSGLLEEGGKMVYDAAGNFINKGIDSYFNNKNDKQNAVLAQPGQQGSSFSPDQYARMTTLQAKKAAQQQQQINLSKNRLGGNPIPIQNAVPNPNQLFNQAIKKSGYAGY